MHQSLKALLTALGLTVPAGGELTDEVATAALSAVTTLKSQADKATALDKAEQDGRILKSERPYLEGLGDQIGVTALSAQLATHQPIAALTRVQTETLPQPPQNREKTATVALSAEELQAARVLGMTPAAFQKIKTEDAQ